MGQLVSLVVRDAAAPLLTMRGVVHGFPASPTAMPALD